MSRTLWSHGSTRNKSTKVVVVTMGSNGMRVKSTMDKVSVSDFHDQWDLSVLVSICVSGSLSVSFALSHPYECLTVY